MRKLFSYTKASMKTCKSAVIASSLLFATTAFSGPVTYQFTLSGFSDGGEVVGSFTGEDLNNDGYLSSFIFSNQNNDDFAGTNFEAGLNEVTSASLIFNGSFNGQEFGGDAGQITSVSLSHDLTDTNDEFFGFPIDLFFVLNYNLHGGSLLGDEAYEGLLIAPFDGMAVFGMGSFLPAPPDNVVYFDEIPAGDETFEIINGLPNGSTLTSGILSNQSNGAPCVAGAACGVMHTVFLDDNFIPNIGGFDITNQFADISRVSAPSSILVFSSIIALALVMRLRKRQ